MYVIRRAEPLDASAIENLAYPEYFAKSSFGDLTYSPENARAMIDLWLRENHTLVAFDKDTGEIVGISSVTVGYTYYEEAEANVDFFFVSEKAEGNGVSRMLAGQTVTDVRDLYGAKVLYADSRSGIGSKNDALFSNLWRKFGLNMLGSVMMGKVA